MLNSKPHVFLFLLLASFFIACAPAFNNNSGNNNSGNKNSANNLGLAISENGQVAFVLRGRAYVLDTNSVRELPTPSAVGAVIWRENAVWVALPKSNLVQRIMGVPSGINLACLPLRLSKLHIFCHDGSVWNYSGEKIGSLPRTPSDQVQLNDQDYVLSGKALYRIDDMGSNAGTINLVSRSASTNLENPEHFLFQDGENILTSAWPSAQLDNRGVYQLRDGYIQFRRNGQIVNSLELTDAQTIAAASGQVAAIGPKTLWLFDASFHELKKITLEGLQ